MIHNNSYSNHINNNSYNNCNSNNNNNNNNVDDDERNNQQQQPKTTPKLQTCSGLAAPLLGWVRLIHARHSASLKVGVQPRTATLPHRNTLKKQVANFGHSYNENQGGANAALPTLQLWEQMALKTKGALTQRARTGGPDSSPTQCFGRSWKASPNIREGFSSNDNKSHLSCVKKDIPAVRSKVPSKTPYLQAACDTSTARAMGCARPHEG